MGIETFNVDETPWSQNNTILSSSFFWQNTSIQVQIVRMNGSLAFAPRCFKTIGWHGKLSTVFDDCCGSELRLLSKEGTDHRGPTDWIRRLTAKKVSFRQIRNWFRSTNLSHTQLWGHLRQLQINTTVPAAILQSARVWRWKKIKMQVLPGRMKTGRLTKTCITCIYIYIPQSFIGRCTSSNSREG